MGNAPGMPVLRIVPDLHAAEPAASGAQAGSPTPVAPESMTVASRPSWTSRLPGATSPWNHTGSFCHGTAIAASQTASAAARGTRESSG